MPIYEYHCDACGAEFEQMRRITDETTPNCEKCGAAEVHRLVSRSSFILKGSGWYVTDYGKSGGKKEDPGAPPAESATPDSSDKKGESGKTETAKPATEPKADKKDKSLAAEG